MDKILDKIKENKKLLVIVGIVLVIIVIVVVFLVKSVFFSSSNLDSRSFIKEYEELNGEKTKDGKEYPEVKIPDDSNIEYLTIEEALDILDNGTATIYIGYPECLYCRSAVQVLLDTAVKSDINKVYYLDISELWSVKEINKKGKIVTKQKADKNYSKLLKELDDLHVEDYVLIDDEGKEVGTKEKRVITPLVLFVVNGDIVSFNVGTLFSQEDPYVPLNQEQVDGLSGIYSYGFKDVLNGLNNK